MYQLQIYIELRIEKVVTTWIYPCYLCFDIVTYKDSEDNRHEQ